MIKINEKILSIPPYISTSWSRITAIHMKGDILAISLVDGDTIYIPSLKTEHVQLIFQFHAENIEKEHAFPSKGDLSKLRGLPEDQATVRFSIGSPLDGMGTPLDGIGMVMNHNPAQSNAPNLPPEVLQKISSITKIMGKNDELHLPQAEPGCNCFHCQIARVVNEPTPPLIEPSPQENVEEEIALEELQFEQWAITQTGDKLYLVTNKLDTQEKYHVYLDKPIGCTCGKEGCEHILAVLKS